MTAPTSDASAPPPPRIETGLVIRSTGSWYTLHLDSGEEIAARLRGRFRLDALEIDETNPLAVGDRVTALVDADGVGFVTAIAPRQSQVSRRASGRKAAIREHVIVANVDAAWVVQSTFGPKFNPGFVDRFLVACETNHVPAGVLINKADLLDEQPRAQDAMTFWADLYTSLGYPVLLTSAETGQGVGALRDALEGKISVVSGPSGVGKSSLLNAVDPTLDLRTAEVSEKTQKGRHTTTFATLHRVAGGWVADTPGIREFGLWDMAPQDLGGYFVEFRPHLSDCRFPDCTHHHEPDCGVQEAVDRGEITPERYGSYLAILETVETEYREAREMRWRRDGRPDDPDEAVEDMDADQLDGAGRGPGEADG